jgi:outer membrane protein insertion porin family
MTVLVAAATGRAATAQDCPRVVPVQPWTKPTEAAAATPAASGQAPPTRVARIDFTGNRAVGSDRLRRAMATKKDRLGRSAATSQWDSARWPEDHRRLCAALFDEGYVTARVGPPAVTDAPGAPASGKPRRVVLTIPVEEGPRYRMGALSFDGLSQLDEDEVRALFDVEPGGWYEQQPIADGLEGLRRRYAARGYAEWAGAAELKPDPARSVADVVVRAEEGLPRFVGRIVFSGHRGTLDQMLRREVLLNEGDLLDTERLRASIERVEGLGYVTVRDVRLAPSARPQALDITFEVEPRPVVRYGLAGGINGLEGASLTAMLGTVNLFGRGDRVLGSVQIGQDVTMFDFVASRPYLFGTPWTAGVQAQKQRLEFDAVEGGGLPAYTRDEGALRLQAQRRVGRRSQLWAGYSFSTVTLETVEPTDTPPAGFGRRRESELTSTYRFDGWDHSWKPLRGLRATGWADWSAGTVDYFKVRGRAFGLVPLGSRAAVGAGVEAGWLETIGSGQELPFDETFLLGGEMDLRGFDVRTVGPRDASGALIGGTRYAVLQAEAHVDVTSWLRAVAFVDAGHAWREGGWPGLSNLLVSTGAEVRFAVPYFRLPLRLIYAYNARRDDFHPRDKFRVAIGPLF